jgi:hypothetical protein
MRRGGALCAPSIGARSKTMIRPPEPSGFTPERSADPLILDFLEWLAPGPRPYAEVMDAWRTSCPRLTIWEDAMDQKLIERRRETGTQLVALTAVGGRMLVTRGR